jgi:glutathione S-transferase
LVVPLIRRSLRATLHGQGLGRHDRQTLYQFGIADIAALGHWLGARTFCFGYETPTVVDLCLAAFIGGIIRQPWHNPLTLATSKYGNLIAHFERVMALSFPEVTKAAAA